MSRPSLERMQQIAARLHKGFKVAELASAFEVCEHTLKRDIEFMRDRLGYSIEYNPETRQWEGQPPKERVL